jgi:DNA-binding transcriptional regulator YiaG
VGTSADSSPSQAEVQALQPQKQTTAGVSFELRKLAASSVAELRRLTGFTWEQLARLFSVSRRSVHFWASGNKMTAANEEHLERVLATIRLIDRGSAHANRTALLAPRGDGVTPFEELTSGRYDAVVALIGRGSTRSPLHLSGLSPVAKAARVPRPPEELADASQERVHQELRKFRPAKSVRTESDG